MLRLLLIYIKLLSIQIRSQMQYRVSFLLEVISTALLNGMYFASLALVLERFGQIAGWKLGEIAFLAGMAETSFATMDMLFSGFDPDGFSPMVRLGRFDQILLRPINITLQVFGSRFIIRRLGRILEGVTILVISFALTDIQWTIGKMLYLPVVFISQVIAMGSLFVVGGTLIFWTVQPIEAVNIVTYGGTELMTYPMNIYPGWIQRFFTYVIPFVFMNFYPALYFLNKPDPLNFPSFAPFLSPFAALSMLLLAMVFWRFGINHYQSTGS